MRLLVIEDDPMIGTAVRTGLLQAGFAVDWVTDGGAAHVALRDGTYDLAVLDLGLTLQQMERSMARSPELSGTSRMV